MKYINKKQTPLGYTLQRRHHDRLIISTEQEIAILVNKEPMPSVMYDGMVVTLQIPKNVYLVRISTRSYGNWIHPEWYDDIQGQNRKLYNFVLLTWFVN
jgi:hypothetical protein